jgi:hypothetical protein
MKVTAKTETKTIVTGATLELTNEETSFLRVLLGGVGGGYGEDLNLIGLDEKLQRFFGIKGTQFREKFCNPLYTRLSDYAAENVSDVHTPNAYERELWQNGHKIDAIKSIRARTGLAPKEAKELAETIR